MKFIIGKKVEMTQVWQNDQVVAVTKIQAGPCTVVQLKNKKNDGYEAVQISYGEQKEKRMKKPQLGHLKKANVKARHLREFRSDVGSLKVGDKIDVSTFVAGDIIKVVANSKGKGFQGVVRRHGFSGQDATHGNKDQLRMPGSIGAGGPQHVFKGKKMAGRMGGGKTTTQNLKIVDIDKDNNILLIKGAIPGGRNGLVLISCAGELKIAEPQIIEDVKVIDAVEIIPEEVIPEVEVTEAEVVKEKIEP
mgnify:CR=1 FL=1